MIINLIQSGGRAAIEYAVGESVKQVSASFINMPDLLTKALRDEMCTADTRAPADWPKTHGALAERVRCGRP